MKRSLALLTSGLVLVGLVRPIQADSIPAAMPNKAEPAQTAAADAKDKAAADAKDKAPAEAKDAKAPAAPASMLAGPATVDGAPVVLDAGCPSSGCGNQESRFAPVLFFGLDDWRGRPESDYQDNFGLRAGANLGIGLYDPWGIGAQIGASYGGYNWDGRDSAAEVTPWQSQVFVTGGFFKRADKGWAFNAAFVYDFMVNDNFSFVSQEPNLSQFRMLLSVPLGSQNEVGTWCAVRNGSTTQTLPVEFGPGSLTFQPVSQYNFFWKHWFEGGTEATIYLGFPDDSRHGLASGSLGTWIVGGGLQVPINDHWAAYGDFAYMKPSATNGSGSFENSYNISFGIAWYPCSCLKQRTACNRGWLPMLPTANNGSFFVDRRFNTPPL